MWICTEFARLSKPWYDTKLVKRVTTSSNSYTNLTGTNLNLNSTWILQRQTFPPAHLQRLHSPHISGKVAKHPFSKRSQLISCLQGWSFCPTSKRWTISKTKGQLPYPGSIPHRLVRRFIFFPHRWKDWFLTLPILIALHRRISWSRVEGSFGGSWIKCLIHF